MQTQCEPRRVVGLPSRHSARRITCRPMTDILRGLASRTSAVHTTVRSRPHQRFIPIRRSMKRQYLRMTATSSPCRGPRGLRVSAAVKCRGAVQRRCFPSLARVCRPANNRCARSLPATGDGRLLALRSRRFTSTLGC